MKLLLIPGIPNSAVGINRLVSISGKYGRKSGSILDILQLGLYHYGFHGI